MIYSHQRDVGTSSKVQNKMMLGGQNGAKIRSDKVPIQNDAWAPMKYAIATPTGDWKALMIVGSRTRADFKAKTNPIIRPRCIVTVYARHDFFSFDDFLSSMFQCQACGFWFDNEYGERS
jgi:hypothetical protein